MKIFTRLNQINPWIKDNLVSKYEFTFIHFLFDFMTKGNVSNFTEKSSFLKTLFQSIRIVLSIYFLFSLR